MSAEIAKRWLEHARADLDTAWSAIRGPRAQPANAAYFVQQAAEKLIKALLVYHGIEPPRLHDLGRLAALLPDRDTLKPQLAALHRFSAFAVAYRYPGGASQDDPPRADEVDAWIVEREGLLAAIELLIAGPAPPAPGTAHG